MHVWSGGLLTSKREICGLGRVQCPPLIVLLFSSWSFFRSIENQSPIALPWGLPTCLLPEDQGLKPPPALEVRSLNHWTTREISSTLFTSTHSV